MPANEAARVVVWRVGDALLAVPLAIAAEAVEGVKPYTEKDAAVTPEWLRGLPMEHVAGLIRVDDRRVAALLAVDALAVE